MKSKKGKGAWTTVAGVVILALLMPGLLKLANSVVRYFVGAEGRLAAISIETGRPLGAMPRVWEALAQGGENLNSFLDETSSEVARLEPQYIRIDHIYDEFGLVKRGEGGLMYDFEKLDKVVGQILDIGAKPFFALSYMPAEISSGDILAEPRDWNDWSRVVEATIEHYSGDLGIEGVYYEVWNEPDLFGNWKMGGKKDYKNLYYFAAKGAGAATNVKPFKFGGPAITGLYKNWIDNFFPYIQKNQLRMDFFSWHRYDLNPEKFREDIVNVDKWIESHPYFNNVEKIITEMGPRSEAGRENDTNVGAAHLVYIMRELAGRAKFGFNFSVSGSWGVIGKPRFQALEYLGRLGPERLPLAGEGTWVKAIAARSNGKFQVVVTNYDRRSIHNEVVPVSFLGLKNKNFVVRMQTLGQEMRTSRAATSEAILQVNVPMAANSVTWIEIEPEP